MTEIGLLKRAGAIAFTNGKSSVANARVMRNVLLYAKDFGALIVHHTEDPSPHRGRGDECRRGGDPARPARRRTRRPRRSCSSATCASSRSPAGAITPRTLSCAESLAVMRAAKARKLPVTCGVSINHLTLERERHRPLPHLLPAAAAAALARTTARPWCAAWRPAISMSIVSSHDPQDADTKRHPFAEAADGAIGLETLLAAALRLYHNGEIGLLPLLRAMTINPAKLLGLPSGRLEKGAPADLILVDLGQPWVVDRPCSGHAPRTRPSTKARCRAACCTRWLPATPSINTLPPIAA